MNEKMGRAEREDREKKRTEKVSLFLGVLEIVQFRAA